MTSFVAANMPMNRMAKAAKALPHDEPFATVIAERTKSVDAIKAPARPTVIATA